MAESTLIFRVHAVQQMFRRGISELQVREVLASGRVIEEYPDDSPFPAQLHLGWVDQRPIHVVSSNDASTDTMYVVTVYVPSPDKWTDGYSKRK